MSDIDQELTQTLTVNPLTSRDSNVNDTYGTDVEYACRQEVGNKIKRSPEGQEILSTSFLMVEASWVPGYGDKHTLPNGKAKRLIIAENKLDEHNNTDHWEAYFE